MSEPSSRDRRRIGDETLQRIEGLADGWSSGAGASAGGDDGAASNDTEPVAREDAEALLGEAFASPPPSAKAPVQDPAPGAERSKRRTHPPPPPGATRAKAASVPPPVPEAAAKPPAPPPARASRSSAPPPVPSAAQASAHAAGEPTPSVVVAPAADDAVDDHEDPTVLSPPSAELRKAKARATGAAATVRESKAVPYRGGLLGDVGYVFAALRASFRAKREREASERRLEVERRARAAELVAMARQALVDDALVLPSVERARTTVAEIEDVRGRRQGAAAAAESEIEALRAARGKVAESAKARNTALSKELAKLEERLSPLEKEATGLRERAGAIRKQLVGLDRKLTTTEGSLVSVKDRDKSVDRGAVEAELAVLRAERDGVAREEPALAAELAELEPQIASLIAHRADKRTALEELQAAELEADARLTDEVNAITARKTVEDRAVAEADKKREKALLELGEDLCIDRPAVLLPALRSIDDHDASIAEFERNLMEVGELLGGIRKGAVFRGCLVLALALAAVIAALVFLIR